MRFACCYVALSDFYNTFIHIYVHNIAYILGHGMEVGQDGRPISLLKQPVVIMKPSINAICCYGGLNDPTNVPFRIILQMFDYYN